MSNFSPESLPGQEHLENREATIEAGINQALATIQENYEHDPSSPENLPYHNAEHTRGVIDRVRQILKAIQEFAPEAVSDSDIELATLAAAFHDTVQQWQAVEGPDGSLKRQRFAGQNEQSSADLAVEFMRQQNLSAEGNIFSEEDKRKVVEAILATVPGWSVEDGTVIQPNLGPGSSLIAKAIGLADVNTAGMVGPEALLSDTATLFREDNLDILEAMQTPDQITDEQKESFRKRMVAWTNTQTNFIAGRRNRLEQELEGIPEASLGAVRQLFNKFDESIEQVQQVAAEREQMDFEQLATTMGYEIAA